MLYKLAIKDVVNVPVKAVFNDGASPRRFEFTLVCNRMKSEPLQEVLKNDEKKTAEFLQEVVVDWSGQRLVLDDAGEPAPFSQEALAVMMTAPGLANMAFSAYLGQVGAREKN